jgi:hypothetical protein
MPISFDPQPSPQLLARRPNLHPREYGAFGSTEAMLAQGRRFVEAGAVKLVLFPASAGDLDQLELERLRYEVAEPLEHS